MRLRPTSTTQPPPAEGEAKAKPDSGDWRWAVIHFPCLEGVVPRSRIIMVSDKKHIPEAIRKYPDLVLWHEKELSLYSEQTDSDVFDDQMFIAVNRLKHKTHGWYMGIEEGAPAVNSGTDAVEGLE